MRNPATWPSQSTLPPLSPRRGPWGWWLRVTLPQGNPNDPALSLDQRELLRRARLASAIIAGLVFVCLLLLPTVLDDLASTIAVSTALVVSLLAILLNRAGRVTAAGYLLVLMLAGAIGLVFIGAPRGVAGLDYFPVYDLLVVPLVVAASLLPGGQIFLVAAINCAFIIGDAVLQPHGFNLNTSDGYSLVAKPLVIEIIIAIVSFLWARSIDQALRRADRAEEIAAMEHQLADQKRQLDVGIRQILDTHVRVANGDFGARAPLTQDNILFQIAASLNNLLNRLGRAGQSEYLYQRTVAEIARLRDSLRAAKSGRAPLWPAPSGTPVDELLQVIAGPARGAPGLSGQLPPTATSAPPNGPWAAPSPSSAPWAMPAPAPSSGTWGTSGDFWPPQTSPALPDMPMGSNLQGPASNTGGWGADAPHASPQPAPYPQQHLQSANPWESPPLSDWPPQGEPNTRG